MSRTPLPCVRYGQPLLVSGQPIRLDTPAWFAWLSQISAFYYIASYPVWRLTVRGEKRRHGLYWYAYARIDGKLHNVYLGKPDALTQAHLEAACHLIDQRARKEVLPSKTP
jgi:LuxR family transcriptional regulator, maltose regulon positive regulatory protein